MAATIQCQSLAKSISMKGDDSESYAPPGLTVRGRKLSELVETIRPVLMDATWPLFEVRVRQFASIDLKADKQWSQLVNSFTDCCERSFGILRGFVAILRHHGARDEVIQSFILQGSVYLATETEIEFVKRAKYLTCFALARYNRNPLPACDVPFRPSGIFNRWMRPRLAKVSRRNTHLWASWFQAKRCARPLSRNMVLVTYMKHRDRMLSKDPGTKEMAREALYLLSPVIETLHKALDKLADDRRRPVSTKSCREFVRRCGGSQAGIAEHLDFGESWTDDLGRQQFTFADDASLTVRLNWFDDLLEIRPTRKIGPNGQTVWSECVRTNISQLTQWNRKTVLLEPFIDAAIECLPNTVVLPQKNADVWYDALDRCNGDIPLECNVKAVIEPLKVRTITAGESLAYHVSGDYQKAVHGCLRRFRCFRLIGRPCSPTDLLDIIRRRRHVRNLFWISADYEASTDNLSRFVSEMINDELTRELDFGPVFRACLDPHRCFYPSFRLDLRKIGTRVYLDLVEKWISEGQAAGLASRGKVVYDGNFAKVFISPCTQVNAQLMGSRVSFVLLCLVNFVLYMKARVIEWREQTGRSGYPGLKKFWEWEGEVLINGDDALFAGTKRLYEIFSSLASSFVLPLSIGKVYFNEVYANINSTSFHLDLRQADSLPVQIDYLNTGLLFGQNKVLGGDDEDEGTRIVDIIDRCVQGSLPGRQVSTLADFLDVNRDVVNAACRGRNLFISKSLGGMGVRCPAGWRYDVSPSQIDEARRRSCRPNVISAARPLWGAEVEVLKDQVYCPWRDLTGGKVAEVQRLPRRSGVRRFVKTDPAMRAWLELGVLTGLRRDPPQIVADCDPLGEIRNRGEYEDLVPLC